MENKKTTYREPVDVDHRLAELRLTREVIVESVKRGLLARLESTPLHPATSAGFNFWSETVRALREKVIPLSVGWEPSNEANQGLIINKETGVYIAVAAGDSNVGVATNTPSTRSPKGPRLVDAVRANNGWLFPDMDPLLQMQKNPDLRSLWLLLVCWSERKKVVQLELSRPIKMADSPHRRPVAWSERILFPDINYGDARKAIAPADSGPTTPEVRIEIKRRA